MFPKKIRAGYYPAKQTKQNKPDDIRNNEQWFFVQIQFGRNEHTEKPAYNAGKTDEETKPACDAGTMDKVF